MTLPIEGGRTYKNNISKRLGRERESGMGVKEKTHS